MTTFTSLLPDPLLVKLKQKADEFKMPKNKIIENALNLYLEHLDRAAYLKSYKRMAEDEDMIQLAEEGLSDYSKVLWKFDKQNG